MQSVWHTVCEWCIAQMPTPAFWNGAATALGTGGWITLGLSMIALATSAFSLVALLGLGLGALLIVLLASLVIPIMWLANRINPQLPWALAFLAITLNFAVPGGSTPAKVLPVVWLIAALVLLGGGIALLRRDGRSWRSLAPTVIGGSALAFFLIALMVRSWPSEEDIVWSPIDSQQLELTAPARKGEYEFDYRTYGSGSDPQRSEFGAEVDHVSESVDGSKLLDRWSGNAGKARTAYWGVEPESLPVQGRAWVPQGEGPYPIVLIVHGNHSMEDYSEVGYAYLGELFASRGFITASVDQNFLNGGYSNLLGIPDPGLEEENDARGWMLLKHLEQWRAWNADVSHEFGGRVDLDRVVLVGHSRGGEAVSEAALFNRLSAYPDDATLDFDFNFGLRGIIAIAPVDAQYKPRDRDTDVRDTNYLVIHGSHDGDVTSFAGSATYSRVEFDACRDCFKTGFYLIGANHGQFNTSWGDSDMSLPMSTRLDRAHLISGEDQRAVAATLFAAFLEAAVHGRDDYRAFLAQPDRAHALLPAGARYLTQYRDARQRVLADFEEDADVRSASLPGATIAGQELALWQESEVGLKWNTADTADVKIGWAPDDARENDPSYAIGWAPLELRADATVSLALAPATATPGDVDDYEPPDETNFTLELSDAHGTTARLRLSQRRALPKQIDPVVFKLHELQENRSEVVFQRYRFEVGEWLDANPELDVSAISGLRLVFDQTAASAIWVDDIALSNEGY